MRRKQFTGNDKPTPNPDAGEPRSYSCSAYGCPHVGAIRLPGSQGLLCEAHAMADPRHWQRITGVLRDHADLLHACRSAMTFPTGLRKEDTDTAKMLLDMAELMPTGVAQRLPSELRGHVRNAGVRSRVVAQAVNRAIVDLALVGTIRRSGPPQVDPDSEVSKIRSELGRLLDRASQSLTQLHEGVA